MKERMDKECISICEVLNSLPGVTTHESCSGHGKEPFNVWFRCDNIDTLSRLGRAVDKNYSDGNWEIVLDSLDTNPRGCFWLRSKSVLPNDVLLRSLEKLEENILFWFKHEFDEYFTNMRKDDFIKDFITVGKLREMLKDLDDDEYITVTKGNVHPNHKITHIDDSTSFGFWEIRIN